MLEAPRVYGQPPGTSRRPSLVGSLCTRATLSARRLLPAILGDAVGTREAGQLPYCVAPPARSQAVYSLTRPGRPQLVAGLNLEPEEKWSTIPGVIKIRGPCVTRGLHGRPCLVIKSRALETALRSLRFH